MKSLYYQKSRWKLVLLLLAAAIGTLSLFYTNRLVNNVAKQERRKMEIWAQAQAELAGSNADLPESNVLFEILGSNDVIPVILTDSKFNIESTLNIDPRIEGDEIKLHAELRTMREQHEPIVNEYHSEEGSYIKYVFYKDSSLLYQLKYYPLYQLGVIAIFILVAYVIFSISRKYEQDYVWVGMAKETAHQLGTPISSLVAWHELLKDENPGSEVLFEVRKDIDRLEMITERFSKIGSLPDLKKQNVKEVIAAALTYLQTRTPGKVSIKLSAPGEGAFALINPPLFNWVVENLIKNAIDAMSGEGAIHIEIMRKGKHTLIDVSDTGKGIAGGKHKDVFKPGYSTKKRGWGLGLTLVKRIVENYHRGKISVKQSSLDKGTTFRISLPN